MKDWQKSSKYLVEGQPAQPRRAMREDFGHPSKRALEAYANAGDRAAPKPLREARIVESRSPNAGDKARIKVARPPRKRYRA